MTAPLSASEPEVSIDRAGFPGRGSVTWSPLGQWRMALVMAAYWCCKRLTPCSVRAWRSTPPDHRLE
ncbi:hypothetical protein JK359_16045 [Streptomyces actinomycinicus]|uniref:Uncharacterized protein n=1 Tax=Streptomyces actinomycinicus TaxID=1695166 RepID=A0A937EI07_9ACTN|nr:hypothetical protein [Streptomyces actinomycinicus]MBL1083467.1 hypothetical protein [Streptomyces actinomycinicus]